MLGRNQRIRLFQGMHSINLSSYISCLFHGKPFYRNTFLFFENVFLFLFSDRPIIAETAASVNLLLQLHELRKPVASSVENIAFLVNDYQNNQENNGNCQNCKNADDITASMVFTLKRSCRLASRCYY